MSIGKKWMTFATVGILSTGLLLAQGPGASRGGPGGDPAARKERMKGFMAEYLNLTESQKQQAEQIFQAARDAATPLREQMKTGHTQMTEAIKTGKSDQELQAIADAQGALMGQISGIHAKAAAKFYAILDPAQKEKAEKLHNRFMGGMFGAGPGAMGRGLGKGRFRQ